MAVSPGLPARRRPERPDLAAVEELSQTAPARLGFTERLLEELAPPAGRAGRRAWPPTFRSAATAARARRRSRATCCRPASRRAGTTPTASAATTSRRSASSLREGRFLTAADSRRARARLRRRRGLRAPLLAARAARSASACSRAREAGDDAEASPSSASSARSSRPLTEDEAQGAVYYPYGHRPDNDDSSWSRARAGARSRSAPRCDSVVRAVDPDLPVTDVRSMETRIADSLVARRSPALLAGLFSGVAVLLTAHRHLRRAELRRRAAPPRDRPAHGAGRAARAGPPAVRHRWPCACWPSGWCSASSAPCGPATPCEVLLFRVPGFHTETLVLTAVLLSAIALVACLAPAYRATRMSPVRGAGRRLERERDRTAWAPAAARSPRRSRRRTTSVPRRSRARSSSYFESEVPGFWLPLPTPVDGFSLPRVSVPTSRRPEFLRACRIRTVRASTVPHVFPGRSPR